MHHVRKFSLAHLFPTSPFILLLSGNLVPIKIPPHLCGSFVLIWVFPHLAGNFVPIGFDLSASR